MELPQSPPFGTKGRKPTHDFLSLYSPVQQDPRPSQGGCLKTHDFLQPLEWVGKSNGKEENATEKTSLEKTQTTPPTPSVEHLLPGGIGTYTISHVSYFNQRVPKLESTVFTVAQASSTDRNEENSNCSSYSGSGFTLWEESAVKKGKTGKENISGDRHVLTEAGVKSGGQWTSERPSLSSSNNHSKNTTFSSLISTQQSLAQKSQNLMDNIRSAKVPNDEEDDDDDEEFILKKEPSSDYKGNLTIKVGAKCTNQNANTPRSKHSATEQRRRSKINDRFQMLREIIPLSDQKRDKASFLLEVIEYIQFLQEKVHKYEGSYQGWNHFPAKLMPWRNNHGSTEGFIDQSQAINCGSGPALMFAEKFEENNVTVSPAIPRNAQNHVGSDMSTATAFKAMDHQPGLTNKVVVPLPVPLQPNIFAHGGSSGAVAPLVPRLMSDADHTPSQTQSQLWQSRSCTTGCTVANDKLKEQDLTIESGTISISSAYSQGLLNTLTQALQSSGVDLSQASISVQIDLGKRANSGPSVPTCIVKDDEVPSNNQGTPHSRAGSSGEESEQALKRLKT